MNLVSAALRRPISVMVIMIAIVLGSGLALVRMPRDIFPDLGVPVIYVAQPYGGMDPAQMEGFLTNYYEYHFLYITGIEHVESKNIQGVALIKLQFHPGTNMAQAMAETIAQVNRARSFMPPGTVPPFVMRFDAGSIPVGNLVFTSPKRSVGELQDLALFRVRPLFATLPGVSAPPPFGASQRTIVVRADPERLKAYDMTPDEIVVALNAANTITPSGNIRIADKMPIVPFNSVVTNVAELRDIPIRTGVYPTVFLRDVAIVEDSSDIATGYALVNGRRTVYIPVTKRADASTLSVVKLVKENLAKFQAVLPDDVKVSYEFDQSPYVTRSLIGLFTEGLLGAVLTGLMVLVFLRDWRSVIIVVLNIPLALLAAVTAMWLGGQTINIMTLGGLAMAVGILVDESTVEIENIHKQLEQTPSVARAVLNATQQTRVPRLLAMLCILAVFLPSFFMVGAARALFIPLSLAVGFSMVASYFLSSTFVPVMSCWLLKRKADAATGRAYAAWLDRYSRVVDQSLRHRGRLLLGYIAASVLITFVLVQWLGVEIFPVVHAGQFQFRLKAPTGTRIEKTEQIALQVMDLIGEEVGRDNIEVSLGFVGVQPPTYPINTIYLWTSGPEEAVMQVQLKHSASVNIEALQERLRSRIAQTTPGVAVSFEPSDIVSRAMSFGSPTPVEIAVAGPSLPANREFAESLRAELAGIKSLRDLQFGQTMDYPAVKIALDRQRAGLTGVTPADVGRAIVAATSSSRYTVPNFWADPASGVGYQVQVEIPQAAMNSVDEVRNLPVGKRGTAQTLLRNLATVTEATSVGEFDRYNMQRMITLQANIAQEDLGSVAGHIADAVARAGQPPPRVNVAVRGQIAPLEQLLFGLRTGLLLTVVVIFLLLAANFQSFRLSLVVVAVVPAVLAGVAIALWLTRTTLNVQSFMGATMAIGVAVANAILLVTFAERARLGGAEANAAAIEGATGRLRAILMTSFAMIAGMLPMAVGWGESGEQAAPLGRAVVGGLIGSTVATLLVLPAIFSLAQGHRGRSSASLDPNDPHSRNHDSQQTPNDGERVAKTVLPQG